MAYQGINYWFLAGEVLVLLGLVAGVVGVVRFVRHRWPGR